MKTIFYAATLFLVQFAVAQNTGFKKTLTDIGVSKNSNNAMVLQPDNKTVTGGFTSNGKIQKLSFLRYDANGNLDVTFGKNGIDTFSNILPTGYKFAVIHSMATQKNGRIIAGGTAYYQVGGSILYSDLFIIGLLPDGKIDSSFGENGLSFLDLGASEDGYSIYVQSDNKILIAGTTFSGLYYRYMLARFLANGKPDNKFKISRSDYNHREDKAYDVAEQADGKIVTVGSSYVYDKGYHIIVTRFLNDGRVDYSFGTNGKIVTMVNGNQGIAKHVAIQTDGKLIVAGTTKTIDGTNDIVVTRLNDNGSTDSSFGKNGIFVKDVYGENEDASQLIIQLNNKILISGSTEKNSIKNFLTMRVLNNGKTDNSFGTQGIVTTSTNNQNDASNDMILKADGSIQLCGYSTNGGSNLYSVVQYTNKGVLDNSFGENGVALTRISLSIDIATQMIKLPWNNTFLVSGSAGNKWALANYTTALKLNKSFGENGKQTFIFGDEYSKTTPAIAIDSAWQKIYLAGQTNQEGFIILRLNKNGSIDSSFAENGILKHEVYSYNGALAIAPDHKIIFGGSYYYSQEDSYSFIARYNPDGTPDESFAPGGTFKKVLLTPHTIVLDKFKNRILMAGQGIVDSENDVFGVAVSAILNTKAKVDNSFGNNGISVNAVPDGNTQPYFKFMISQDNTGKIYVNGAVQSYSSFHYVMSLTRFLFNGKADTTFGKKGMVITDVTDDMYSQSANEGLAFNYNNGDLQVITAGYKGYPDYYSRFIGVAYDNKGVIDSFTNTSNGYIDTLFYGNDYEAGYAVMIDNGYLYFAGQGGDYNESDFMLVRFALPEQKAIASNKTKPVYYLKANPNPAHGFVNVTFVVTESTTIQFNLISLTSGKLYMLQKQALTKGMHQTKINLPVAVPKGLYELQLITNKGSEAVKILVE